jgi:hypothetical protein
VKGEIELLMLDYLVRRDKTVAVDFIGKIFFPVTFINIMRRYCRDILIYCHSIRYQFSLSSDCYAINYEVSRAALNFAACFLRYSSYRKHYER